MLFQGFNLRHILVLTVVYGRAVLRSGAGLLFLNLFLFTGLILASVMIDIIKPMQQNMEIREQAKAGKEGRKAAPPPASQEQVIRQFHRVIVAWFLGVKDEGEGKEGRSPFLDYLMTEQSPILSTYFILLLVAIPFTTCMAAFNLLSGDIGTKGLRYLLLRTERVNIFLSRFLGTFIFVNVISFAMIFVVIFFHLLKFPPADNAGVVSVCLWGFRGWLAVLVLGLPYLALCGLLSAMVDTPIVSMVLCYLSVGFPILVLKFVGNSLPANLNADWVDRLTPWGWRNELLYPLADLPTVLLGVGVHLGFAAFFFLLGVWHFSKRDL